MTNFTDEELRQAIETDSIRPVLQPIVDITTGKIKGVEVLARWTGPGGAEVPPEDFIVRAIETKLIISLTFSLMDSVRAKISVLPPFQNMLMISFNAEQECLRSFAFVAACKYFMATLSPLRTDLIVEVTEREPMSAESLQKLAELHNAGAKIALDDFGSGHATMDVLDVLCPDIVKTDISLTSLSREDDPDGLLTQCLQELHSRTGITVVGECVETQQEAEWLAKHGVTLMQGWAFGRPLEIDALLSLMHLNMPKPSLMNK
ncbi:EAL domain-containing protein [Enterobacter bugandensis]|uniref:EAL domain-containing protein n=1 Tax=Enterobacter bugandensis TaxID=881260 RepID=UPI0022E1B6D5|nr:EAL domain-containing protein [Enterobacter bugandensis]